MLKKILLGLLGVILLLGIGGYLYYRFVLFVPSLISDQDRAQLKIMPLPAELRLKSGAFEVTKDFGIQFTDQSTDRLVRAADRFKTRLSKSTGINFSGTSGLSIACANQSSTYPRLGEDESYRLNVTPKGIELLANSEFGVLMGMESILQLIEGTSMPSLEIVDSPRFPWRGIMIDVSRHWIPKPVILRNLDAMAAAKMNVLHLHLTDDQGFRVESKVYPKLHEEGSNGCYFTHDDIREIILYASDRGIRVVPEFDVPGHTKSWLIAYPEFASIAGSFSFGRKAGDDIFSTPLNPVKEETYVFVENLFTEMAGLFPDAYFHIGGDEVNPTAWEGEEFEAFKAEKNIVDAHGLQAYFNARMAEILRKLGKKMMGWEEILQPELSNDILIQSWKNQKTLFQGVQQGSNAILSAGLYLDHKLHAAKHYEVDPLILPGAVDIEPDSGQWTMYDLTMELPGNTMQSQLVIFDRDPSNVSGFFAMTDQRNAFKAGTIEKEHIRFSFDAGGIGTLNYHGELIGDSLSGNISFGLLKFASRGKISGGSRIPGSVMPKIEVIKPLTSEEESRILGAEAAMWSEVVSMKTIDSRLWPRTAAIAEKLWSPASLTTDVDDMYRRLAHFSARLEEMGLSHVSHGEELLREIGGKAYPDLKEVVDVMEEAKFYNRLAPIMTMEEVYLPDLPLNTLADAALPESVVALRFNKLVERYKDYPNEEDKQEIIAYLEKWAGSYVKLAPYFETNERMADIKGLTENLSMISALALSSVHSGANEYQDREIAETLNYLEAGDNGLVVAVVPGLRSILD